MIKQSVKNGAEPFLLLDAGALLFNNPALPTSYLESKKIQAVGIVQAMQKMQYSAIGLSPFDLTAGAEFVKGLQDDYDIPFVSVNLVDKNTGRKIFRPYITKKLDNLTATIIGLTATTGARFDSQDDYTTLPWQESLSETLKEVSSESDMIILLSSFPAQQNRQIADLFDQIDIILQSGTSTANIPPQIIQNTLIAQTSGKGKYIGRLDIDWLPPSQWALNKNEVMVQQLNDRLTSINTEIDQLAKKFSAARLQSNKHYRYLIREKTRISEELESKGNPEEVNTQKQSTFRNSFISLRKSLPQDPEVENILSQAKEHAFTANRKRLTRLRLETAQTNLLTSLVGKEKCKECHPVQYERWQKTDHAQAWKTLEAKKQQYNEDCLICHVTLPIYNREKVVETDLLTVLPKVFQSVSCESCHGPGRLHITAPEKNKPQLTTEKTCRICHTIEQDKKFDFAQKLKRLQCTARNSSEG